jgi:hypothetical protein
LNDIFAIIQNLSEKFSAEKEFCEIDPSITMMLSKIIYFLFKFPPQQFPRAKNRLELFSTVVFRETAGFLLACIFSGNGRQDEVAEIFSSENETLILRNFYG